MPDSWTTSIDAYCERLDSGFWAEPLNAVTNAAFLIAAALAFLQWRRAGAKDRSALWLIAVAVAVGIGSFLFHTFAQRWAALADVLPIAVFIYSYFFIAMRRYLRLSLFAAMAVTVLFVAFNMSFGRLWFGLFPGITLNGSVGYLPAVLALLVVGIACFMTDSGKAGRALLLAAGTFGLSLAFRSVDSAACAAWPIGTHLFWHMLNGLVLWILMNAAIANRREHAR